MLFNNIVSHIIIGSDTSSAFTIINTYIRLKHIVNIKTMKKDGIVEKNVNRSLKKTFPIHFIRKKASFWSNLDVKCQLNHERYYNSLKQSSFVLVANKLIILLFSANIKKTEQSRALLQLLEVNVLCCKYRYSIEFKTEFTKHCSRYLFIKRLNMSNIWTESTSNCHNSIINLWVVLQVSFMCCFYFSRDFFCFALCVSLNLAQLLLWFTVTTWETKFTL